MQTVNFVAKFNHSGVNSNVDKGESTSESSAFHKRVYVIFLTQPLFMRTPSFHELISVRASVEEFCILFQGRLKNSSAILVKVLYI